MRITAPLTAAVLTTLLALPHAQPGAAFDLVIRNGRIIDGTGSPWYAGDVGIRAGRIAAIGRLGDVARDRRWTRPAWWWHPDSSTCWGSPT